MRDSILELQQDNWDKYNPRPAWRVRSAVPAIGPRSGTNSRGDLYTRSLNRITHISLSSTRASFVIIGGYIRTQLNEPLLKSAGFSLFREWGGGLMESEIESKRRSRVKGRFVYSRIQARGKD